MEATLVPDVVVQQIIEPPIIADAEVAIAPSTHVDFTAVATDVEAQAFRSTETTSVTATIEEPQAKKVRRSRGEKVPRWTSEEEERLRALVGQNGDRRRGIIEDGKIKEFHIFDDSQKLAHAMKAL